MFLIYSTLYWSDTVCIDYRIIPEEKITQHSKNSLLAKLWNMSHFINVTCSKDEWNINNCKYNTSVNPTVYLWDHKQTDHSPGIGPVLSCPGPEPELTHHYIWVTFGGDYILTIESFLTVFRWVAV